MTHISSPLGCIQAGFLILQADNFQPGALGEGIVYLKDGKPGLDPAPRTGWNCIYARPCVKLKLYWQWGPLVADSSKCQWIIQMRQNQINWFICESHTRVLTPIKEFINNIIILSKDLSYFHSKDDLKCMLKMATKSFNDWRPNNHHNILNKTGEKELNQRLVL